MKYLMLFLGLFLSAHALASPPAIPLNQYLAALDYFQKGEPSGCGLRVTGETGDNLWINALVNVSMKESGALFGLFKVVVKRINMKNGKPLMQDGKVMYSSIGNIHKGWIMAASGVRFVAGKNGGGPHNEGYMAPMEFDNAMALLVAIPQANFRIGFSVKGDETERVFEFNKRISQDEALKLTSCMENLRDAKKGKGGSRL